MHIKHSRGVDGDKTQCIDSQLVTIDTQTIPFIHRIVSFFYCVFYRKYECKLSGEKYERELIDFVKLDIGTRLLPLEIIIKYYDLLKNNNIL